MNMSLQISSRRTRAALAAVSLLTLIVALPMGAPAQTLPTVTPIHDIQGPGSSSPIVGATVTTEGIVTGWDDEVGMSATGDRLPEDAGIFLQTPNAVWDADPATSQGLFVGMVSDPTSYPLGSVVRVNGLVTERFGQTMLVATANEEPEIIGTMTLPEPVVINPSDVANQPPDRPAFERLEGMRVVLEVGVANSGGTNRYGELFLTPGPELDRVFHDEDQADLLATDADAGAGDPDNPLRDPDGSTTVVNADLFDQVQDVVGPLAFSYSHFKIMVQPDALPTVIDGPTTFPYSGLAPAGLHDVRIASFNVGNYLAAGSELDHGIVTAGEEAAKRSEIATAIDELLLRPDVVAVQEVENLALLQALAAELGGYTAYLEEGNDSRGIDVGFLVKNTVSASNLRQLGKTATNPTGSTCADVAGMLFDRPPLFIDISTVNGTTFTVATNHFSSRSAPDECRAAQAAFVRDRVAEIEAAGGQVIVTGDLNAFEDESALATLEDGTTTLDNLWDTAPADERYSYQYNGRLQTLDHVLITTGLQPLVGGFQYAHVNVDYYARAGIDGHRVSDHDPAVLTLIDTPDEPEWDASVTDRRTRATFSIDLDGQRIRFVNPAIDTGALGDSRMFSSPLLTIGRVVTDEFIVTYSILGPPTRGVAMVNVIDRTLGRTYTLRGRMAPVLAG